MIRRVALSLVGVVILFAASADADEVDCSWARLGAAGKYAGCMGKSLARNSSSSTLKCQQKYAATWTKLGTKYPGTSCVGARFVDNGDGTITDNLTRLVWEKKDSSDGGANLSNRHDVDNAYSWSAVDADADGTVFTDFLANLNSSGFAGQHDWRLPTFSEFKSILATNASPCGAAPCVADPLFLPTTLSFYWSSSTDQELPTHAFAEYFGEGWGGGYPKTFVFGVRAVRGGL